MCRSSRQGKDRGRVAEGKIEGKIEGVVAVAVNKFCSRDKVFAVDELATPLANAFFIKAADPLYESVVATREGCRAEGGGGGDVSRYILVSIRMPYILLYLYLSDTYGHARNHSQKPDLVPVYDCDCKNI